MWENSCFQVKTCQTYLQTDYQLAAQLWGNEKVFFKRVWGKLAYVKMAKKLNGNS